MSKDLEFLIAKPYQLQTRVFIKVQLLQLELANHFLLIETKKSL